MTKYKSPASRLVRVFKKSRDQWKERANQKQKRVRGFGDTGAVLMVSSVDIVYSPYVNRLCIAPILLVKVAISVRITRKVGVKDSFVGKTRRNNQSLRWGGALAASDTCAG